MLHSLPSVCRISLLALFAISVASPLGCGPASERADDLSCDEAVAVLQGCTANPEASECSDDSPAGQLFASGECAFPSGAKADWLGNLEEGDGCRWNWQCSSDAGLVCSVLPGHPASSGTCAKPDSRALPDDEEQLLGMVRGALFRNDKGDEVTIDTYARLASGKVRGYALDFIYLTSEANGDDFSLIYKSGLATDCRWSLSLKSYRDLDGRDAFNLAEVEFDDSQNTGSRRSPLFTGFGRSAWKRSSRCAGCRSRGARAPTGNCPGITGL